MKPLSRPGLLFSLALAALFNIHFTLFAQGTAFTYNGQLDANGSPANGTYNLQFSLYNASTNGILVAGPVTNNGVAVANGIFAVTIDFGAGPWNGETNWLQIAVETNGGAAFINLAPLQEMTPVPYSIFANTASNLAGTLPASQLSGTISGNGGGLTNVPGTVVWQTVGGTSQTAASNQAYLLTNGAPTMLTLPASPNVGDLVTVSSTGNTGWQVSPNTGQIIAGLTTNQTIQVSQSNQTSDVWTAQTGAPSAGWSGVASSADGTKLVAVISGGLIYTSTNSGVTWIVQSNGIAGNGIQDWTSVASSSDGTHLAAVVFNGQIYTSTNSGLTWVQTSAPDAYWTSVASSSDGTMLVAGLYGTVDDPGYIYTSANSGSTWVQSGSSNLVWQSVASSSDGTRLVAGSRFYLYTSTNSGATWTAQTSAPSSIWWSVASSSDGTRLIAGGSYVPVYTSTNSGATWTAQTNTPATGNWYATASSADGTKLAAAMFGGLIYVSTDSGATWIAQTNAPAIGWYSAASSADGSKLVAVADGGQIYTYSGATVTSPTNTIVTSLPYSGIAGATVQFQYVGDGMWQPVSEPASQITGTLSAQQLPTAVVTNNETGVTLGGTFSGNGAGLTNLNAATPGTINESSITIGATNVIAPLTVTPTMPTNAIGTAVVPNPSSVAVAGGYAYVMAGGNLQIFDVSTPSSPANISSVGSGGSAVVVAGRYAYVAGNGLQIFDVSNPSLPIEVGSAGTGSDPYSDSVAVAGHYAYVVNNGAGTLQIIDISNPSVPVDDGSTGTSSQPFSVAVAGHYVYVTTFQTLEVFDVSNPSSPAAVSSVASGGLAVAVAGRYAYVGNTGATELQVFDVSNPTNLLLVGSVNTGGGGPRSVAVAGRYAYVVTFNTFEIIDVSTPSAPVLADSIGSANFPIIPTSVAVAGRYAYVASQANNFPPASAALQILDLGGAYIQQMEAGTIETGTLQTRDTVTVGNNLNVSGGLNVSGSAEISGGLNVNNLVGGATTNILIGGHTFYITNGVIMNVQ
jgi:hypothetical protein